jgi:hypothetical protein
MPSSLRSALHDRVLAWSSSSQSIASPIYENIFYASVAFGALQSPEYGCRAPPRVLLEPRDLSNEDHDGEGHRIE